jgi:hypothetical protein
MTDLPPPPVSADLDLRDFRWMKLDLIALFNSDFNATPDDTAWRAGVTLWGKAWHQVPAGSLPTDDATLCNLAGLGRDLKTWRRIKPVALRGFSEHSDGRLYHRYVCQMATEAHEERQRYEHKKASDRARKQKQNPYDGGGGSGGIPAERRDSSDGIPTEETASSTGSPRFFSVEGQGQGEEEKKDTSSLRSDDAARGSADAEPAAPSPEKPIVEILFGSCLRYLTANGIAEPKARKVIGAWRRDYGDGEVAAAIGEAQKDAASEPIALVVAILQRRRDSRARASPGRSVPYSNSSLARSLLQDQHDEHDSADQSRNGADVQSSGRAGERGSGAVIPLGRLRISGPDEAESG